MTRRLVLVRHGQTAWNLEKRAQGHADVPLDDVGHAQAVGVAPHLAALEPVALWSSDLSRAVQTAEYVATATGLEVRLDARLREFDVGERQGMTLEEFADAFPDEYATHRGFSTWGVPGAETPDDVARRIVPAFEEFLKTLESGQTGLVVTHGAAVRVGIVGLLGWPLETTSNLRPLGNCAWATLEWSGEGSHVRLAEYGFSPR